MDKKTVLLVEDDELIRKSLKVTIETDCSYTVIDFPDGTVAIKALSEKKLQIDAAVLDIVMHGHGGSIRDYLKKTPEYSNTLIIFYTGLEKQEFDNRILQGAHYLSKEKATVKQVGEILKKLLE